MTELHCRMTADDRELTRQWQKLRDSQRKETRDDEPLSYRSCAVRAESINVDERSVETIITTETPTPMWDWDRYEMVPEVLLMSGAEWPSNKQVPFLNAHNRSSIETQLGSTRQLHTDGPNLIGRHFFAKSSIDAFEKVREGHVTDTSAGYQVKVKTYIPVGETAMIEGREFSGPVNVVTKWKLREASLVPIGADELAKLRGLDLNRPHKLEGLIVTADLREFCVTQGMPTDLDDVKAQDWMAKNLAKKAEPAHVPVGKQVDVTDLVREEIRKGLEADRQRVVTEHKRADNLCELAGLPEERAACYALDGDDDKIREHLNKAREQRSSKIPGAPIFVPGEAQRDKHYGEAHACLVGKAIHGACGGNETKYQKYFPEAERKLAETSSLRYQGILGIAKHCLQIDGVRIDGLTNEQIAIEALNWRTPSIRGAFDPAYHVTGSFAKLTQDAINKSMMVGYTEVPTTWRVCFRQGESVPDFKTIHRMRMGAMPNLPDWPDNSAVEQVSLKDAEETYAVEPKSLKLTLSYRLLVNDDMSVLSRMAPMFGAAAARSVNAAAWAQVTANGLTSDGVALFSAATGARKRSNLTTGAGAPSVSTVQTLRSKMRLMRGENTPEGNESQDILNLTPAFIVGPTAVETSIMQLVLSAYDPASSTFMVYNPASQLVPVIEPLLDVNSTTAWYLFASTSQTDTVEVTFLQGHETPVTRNWQDPETLSQNYAVLQAFAAKALQHRGMQRHDGA